MAARVLAIAELVVGRLATARSAAPGEIVQSDRAGAVVGRVITAAANIGDRAQALGGESSVDSRLPNCL